MICGWLGSPGRMQPIYSTPSMSVSAPVERSFSVTLGGKRVVRSAPGGHREWDMAADGSDAFDGSAIKMFADGHWGVGPWWWLSPWAVGVNMLTPAGSLLKYANLVSGATTGGPVQVEGGRWFPVSAVVSGGSANGVARSAATGTIPVIPGEPVSGSLFVSPGMSARLSFFTEPGVLVSSISSPVAGSGSLLKRVSVSGVVPSNAYRLRFDAVGSGQCAGASASMTPTAPLWAVGDGCENAIVEAEDKSVEVISSAPWSNQSFTIKEVG